MSGGLGASPRPKPPLAFPRQLYSFSRLSESLEQAIAATVSKTKYSYKGEQRTKKLIKCAVVKFVLRPYDCRYKVVRLLKSSTDFKTVSFLRCFVFDLGCFELRYPFSILLEYGLRGTISKNGIPRQGLFPMNVDCFQPDWLLLLIPSLV